MSWIENDRAFATFSLVLAFALAIALGAFPIPEALSGPLMGAIPMLITFAAGAFLRSRRDPVPSALGEMGLISPAVATGEATAIHHFGEMGLISPRPGARDPVPSAPASTVDTQKIAPE